MQSHPTSRGPGNQPDLLDARAYTMRRGPYEGRSLASMAADPCAIHYLRWLAAKQVDGVADHARVVLAHHDRRGQAVGR